MLKKFWSDENGAIISAELVLVLTIVILSLVVGLTELAVAINGELNDVANGIGALNQEYSYTGFRSIDATTSRFKSAAGGSRFTDGVDICDLNTAADLVCDAPVNDTCG